MSVTLKINSELDLTFSPYGHYNIIKIETLESKLKRMN